MEQNTAKESLIAAINGETDITALEAADKIVKEKGLAGIAALPEEMQALKEKATVLEQEKDKFFSIISFDLGSPLNSLKALSDMLMADAHKLDKNTVLEFNDHIHKQIVTLSEKMSDMIDWASFSVGNVALSPSLFDMNKLVADVLKKNGNHADKKSIQLTAELPENLKAWGDPKMIGKALSSIVSNGVKFTLKDGSVKVRAWEEGGKVWVSVTDTGMGMGKAKVKNIFNPERKNTQKGTANESGMGLGLIVAKQILAFNGSEISLESNPGKGTVVSFSLPAQGPVNEE